MATNNFIKILQTRGFTQGDSGRWISPEAKYSDSGVVVELQGKDAVAMWAGGRTLFEGGNKRDLARFKEEVV